MISESANHMELDARHTTSMKVTEGVRSFKDALNGYCSFVENSQCKKRQKKRLLIFFSKRVMEKLSSI
jgi:hypothetical protein